MTENVRLPEKLRWIEQLRTKDGQRKLLPVLVPAGLSILVGTVVMLQGTLQGGPTIETPRYLISVRPLKEGDTLQLEDLRFTHLSSTQEAVATDQDLDRVVGATLLEPIPEGEPLRYAAIRLASKDKKRLKVPRGLRAFAVEIDALLDARAGDSVDVFGGELESGGEPRLIVESAQILKVRSGQALIAVPQAAVGPLQKAAVRGKLSVALCSREETGSARLRRKRARPAKKSIRIWTEET